eukprot:gnl/TRDRNA2_/TRDRNA2_174669_c2_seq3.p2 gnl/TRDRNA2_/TRDRNA2_174669_c2~~gnl/TRDRNA2_/TRDRNA2_174669_c2_seq3.p2  ORF type:complete len:187 (-),score=49.46 gnl/TRDRNA2_/TRDRNA2_174669_c2_seq3:266-826(-)
MNQKSILQYKHQTKGFFNFAVFNILTGLFVEQALQCAEPDHDAQVFEQRIQEIADRETMKELCQDMDANGDGLITLAEFKRHLRTPKGRHMLKLQGIDVEDAELFFQLLVDASESDEVQMRVFRDCAMRMKGMAKSIDLQVLFYETKMLSNRQQHLEDHLSAQMMSILEKLSGLTPVQDVPAPAQA